MDDFKTVLRQLATRLGARILVVGGVPSSGKTTLIKNLTNMPDVRTQSVALDLQLVRDRLILDSPNAIISLQRKLGVSNKAAFNDLRIPSDVFRSVYSLRLYYAWLEEICRPYVLCKLSETGRDNRIWILELVTPIDRWWNVGDLWVELRPPKWKIDSRMASRERIALASARIRRYAYDRLAELDTNNNEPQIRADDSDESVATSIKLALVQLRWF